MFDLEQELKNLPEDPGVYIMHDKDEYMSVRRRYLKTVSDSIFRKIQTTHRKFLQWCRTWHILNILSQTPKQRRLRLNVIL